jgi:hypothetical protein
MLHDFCMIIPFSILIVLAGLITIPFGAGVKGVILAAVGCVELGLSSMSLRKFQARESSAPFTAGSTGPLRFWLPLLAVLRTTRSRKKSHEMCSVPFEMRYSNYDEPTVEGMCTVPFLLSFRRRGRLKVVCRSLGNRNVHAQTSQSFRPWH